jgi:hypothetical protein
LSIGDVKIALPFMSFISFVGGSLGSSFRFDVVDVGVIHVGMLLKTGDDDFLDSLLEF